MNNDVGRKIIKVNLYKLNNESRYINENCNIQFIENDISSEYKLSKKGKLKSTIDEYDLNQLLLFLWSTDIVYFPHERYRAQLATLWLASADTAARVSHFCEPPSVKG